MEGSRIAIKHQIINKARIRADNGVGSEAIEKLVVVIRATHGDKVGLAGVIVGGWLKKLFLEAGT